MSSTNSPHKLSGLTVRPIQKKPNKNSCVSSITSSTINETETYQSSSERTIIFDDPSAPKRKPKLSVQYPHTNRISLNSSVNGQDGNLDFSYHIPHNNNPTSSLSSICSVHSCIVDSVSKLEPKKQSSSIESDRTNHIKPRPDVSKYHIKRRDPVTKQTKIVPKMVQNLEANRTKVPEHQLIEEDWRAYRSVLHSTERGRMAALPKEQQRELFLRDNVIANRCLNQRVDNAALLKKSDDFIESLAAGERLSDYKPAMPAPVGLMFRRFTGDTWRDLNEKWPDMDEKLRDMEENLRKNDEKSREMYNKLRRMEEKSKREMEEILRVRAGLVVRPFTDENIEGRYGLDMLDMDELSGVMNEKSRILDRNSREMDEKSKDTDEKSRSMDQRCREMEECSRAPAPRPSPVTSPCRPVSVPSLVLPSIDRDMYHVTADMRGDMRTHQECLAYDPDTLVTSRTENTRVYNEPDSVSRDVLCDDVTMSLLERTHMALHAPKRHNCPCFVVDQPLVLPQVSSRRLCPSPPPSLAQMPSQASVQGVSEDTFTHICQNVRRRQIARNRSILSMSSSIFH